MGFVFSAKNGFCPECVAFGRRWYIEDRLLYGDVYEYCLMSVSTAPQPTYQFKEKKELAAWLNDFDEYREKNDWWIDYSIRRWIKNDYANVALIEKAGVQYRYDKDKNTLTVLPEQHQESGWYDKYRECLAFAKALLSKTSSNQISQNKGA